MRTLSHQPQSQFKIDSSASLKFTPKLWLTLRFTNIQLTVHSPSHRPVPIETSQELLLEIDSVPDLLSLTSCSTASTTVPHATQDHVKMNGDAADMATSRAGFHILKASTRGPASARLGTLSIKGRKSIETPNFVAMSSRGVIPHLTPDMVIKATDFGAAHMALEDCMYMSNTQVSLRG